MILENIEVKNFRCLKKVSLDFNQKLNIIVGNNGQGKTSLLEAIYLLAFTKSHKTISEREVIMTETDFTKVSGEFTRNEYKSKFSFTITKTNKKAEINNSLQKKLSEYIGNINLVMFSPEDFSIVKGDPAKKRKFIDIEVGQTSPMYIYNLLLYRKILKQRNELLKKIARKEINDIKLLDIISEQLCDVGEKIVCEREVFIQKLVKYIQSIHKDLTNKAEDVNIIYKRTYKENLLRDMKNKYEYDIVTGSTSIGPHRDNFVILLNNQDISVYGSQGQQRTAILSIKLALIDFINEKKSENPILLLDDVFSELDVERLNSLVKFINRDIQTFITTTDISLIDQELIKEATIYIVNEGKYKVGGGND